MSISRSDLVRASIKRVFGEAPDSMRAVKEDIGDAADGENMLRMRYIPKGASAPKTYVVEPYSYRRKHGKDYFYAWHPKHDQIHSFLQSRIVSAEPMKKEFDPRFEVEI